METQSLQGQTIQIDGMTSDACIQKVRSALVGVSGVTTDSVKIGTAHIRADKAGSDAARAAIGAAGFKVRSHTAHADNTPANVKNQAQPGATTPAGQVAGAALPGARPAPAANAVVNGAGGATHTKTAVEGTAKPS